MCRVLEKVPELRPGDDCETLSLVPVRLEEAVYTRIVTDLPVGTTFKVLQLSPKAPKRVKVSAGATVGWITTSTVKGEALVRRLRQKPESADENFVIGQQHEAKSLLVVREGEGVDSALVAELDCGTVVRILEFSKTHVNRARVATQDCDGWVSLVTRRGQVLLGRLTDPMRQGVVRVAGEADKLPCSQTETKLLLELARSGDARGLQRLVEDAPEGRINVNAGDIRGRTPLMFAAAFCMEAAVAYLLSHADVQVSAMDDTAKTALHHAAKWHPRGGAGNDDKSQAAMLAMLISNGSQIEARDHNGCTSLMFAAASGDAQAVKVLLRSRANPNAKDYEGNNAVDYARSIKDHGMVRLLQHHGAAEVSDLEVKRTATLQIDASRNKAIQRAGIRRMLSGDVGMKDKVISVEDTGTAERARAKLAIMMKVDDGGANEPAELEKAMKDAVEAGVDDSELMAGAEKRLEQLKATVKAQRDLFLAMEEPSVKALREAIAVAEERGVSKADVDAAKAALAEQSVKEEAMRRLRDAQDRGDATSLRAALEEARRAKVDEADIAHAEALLRSTESKERAQEALEAAIASKDPSGLRFAIKLATEAGADPALVERAQEVLRVEAPRQEARAALTEAVKAQTAEALRPAIANAREKGVDANEIEEADELLQQVEVREQALQQVQHALEKARPLALSGSGCDVDVLKEVKELLTRTVQAAKLAGSTEDQVREAEARRRKIHNAIEDIKGSIRVFCRVRPLSSKEKGTGDAEVTSRTDSMTISLLPPIGENSSRPASFQFDSVFMPGTQEEVFEDCKDLVQSAVDGYNVTMFAYGQTGAGKTFTMYGTKGAEGTAPRTIKEIYKIIDRDQGRFNYTVMGSMMELYRNDLVDLLAKSRASLPARRTMAETAMQPAKLNMRMDKSGGVFIENLTEEECKDAEELSSLLERGNDMRTVAATAMNLESSRSHLLVVIKIVSVNLETRDQIKGKILLCDLAGSERLKKSEVTGEMQKEAIEINKSLTALGDVIEALTKGKGQIPYRNHKLTQVMQDALGGSSKTLMFVNCSPASSNYDETLMSLKYATRAKRINNDAKKMVKSGSRLDVSRPVA